MGKCGENTVENRPFSPALSNPREKLRMLSTPPVDAQTQPSQPVSPLFHNIFPYGYYY